MARPVTKTMLFTDLVSSTASRAQMGDVAADELMREHFAQMQAEIDESGGELVKTQGDGVMAAFDSTFRFEITIDAPLYWRIWTEISERRGWGS